MEGVLLPKLQWYCQTWFQVGWFHFKLEEMVYLRRWVAGVYGIVCMLFTVGACGITGNCDVGWFRWSFFWEHHTIPERALKSYYEFLHFCTCLIAALYWVGLMHLPVRRESRIALAEGQPEEGNFAGRTMGNKRWRVSTGWKKAQNGRHNGRRRRTITEVTILGKMFKWEKNRYETDGNDAGTTAAVGFDEGDETTN